MKYFNTLIEEQETLINILYDEQLIRIYTNRIEVIQELINEIGQPTKKYKKSKTYWSGASWDIHFTEHQKINNILNRKLIIDDNFCARETKKKHKLAKNSLEQFSFL